MKKDNYKIALEKYVKQLDNPKFSEIYDIEENSLVQTYLNGRLCPHCKSRHVVSNGNYKGRKKYKCKDCGKNFNDLPKTPFSGIHKLDKMKIYIDCMIKGYSIKRSAAQTGIAESTAFEWRHKILSKIKQLPDAKLKEVIELEEVRKKYSAKGQTKQVTKEVKNSIYSLVFATDGARNLRSDKIKFCNRHQNKILIQFSDISYNKNIFKCPRKTVFSEFANHIENVYFVDDTSNNTTNIKNQITRWENWMQRFHGVATDYLQNYLQWFDFLQNSKRKSNRINSLISISLHHNLVT